MRKVTYGVACSLDGFIARSDGAVEWLLFTDDAKKLMADYWPRVDTVLMGRKTWEAAVAHGTGGCGMGGIRSFVFSRTLATLPGRGAELVRDDAGAFVRALKQEPGKEICVLGGGELAASLLAAGVVDEIGLNVHPVLLGSGIPMLADPRRQIDLELAECRAMAGGCVLLSYRTRAAAPTGKSAPRRRAKA